MTAGRSAGGGDEQETPQALFDAIDTLLGFTLDVCASKENCKVPYYFDKEKDGLAQSWSGHRWWMNPPYSRGSIKKWLMKAVAEVSKGDSMGVALIPGDMGTAWWRDWVAPFALIKPIEGRVTFTGYSWPNTVPSVFAIYLPRFSSRGVVVPLDVCGTLDKKT